MSNIHPSAVIEPGARIASDAIVGPFCYVGRHAVLGSGTRLISHVTILGRTTLGRNNTVWCHATLGGDPQDLKFNGEEVFLDIGDHNEIRENVTIHLGTANGGGFTRLGSDNLIMVGTHIAHDCTVGNHTLLANNTMLAGHVNVEDHANVAGGVGIHHFCTIGQYSFVGGLTGVVKDVPPFCVYDGDPARERGVNTIGLERHGFDPVTITRLKDAFKRLFRSERTAIGQVAAKPLNLTGKGHTNGSPLAHPPGTPGNPGTPGTPAPASPDHARHAPSLAERLASVEADYGDDECVRILCQFLRNRSIGLSGRYLETLRKDDRRKRGFNAAPAEPSAQPAPVVVVRK